MINIGTIQLTDNSEIIFYTDIYNGKNYGYVRKFWLQKPTKKGIMAQINNWKLIYDALKLLPENVEDVNEGEVINIQINEHKYIRVNIEKYKGSIYLDIRDYYETEKYTGPSKKGVKIPFEFLQETKEFLEEMIERLKEWPEGSFFSNEDESSNGVIIKEENIEGVPEKYGRYFK